jgi:hypothetical protein
MAYEHILEGKREGGEALGRPRRRLKKSIKLILKKYGGTVWTAFVLFRKASNNERGNEPSASIKSANFLTN